MRPLIYFTLFFRLFSAQKLCSQPFHFNKLGIEEGLSQSNNEYRFIDSRGLLWVGSLDGLNCFDGKNIKSFRPSPSDFSALAGGNIQSGFIEDDTQNLWFTTWEAVHRYNRKDDDFTRFQLNEEKGVPVMGYKLVWQDPDKQLWLIVNQKTLYRLNPENGHFEQKWAFPKAATWAVGFGDQAGKLQYAIGNEEIENTIYVIEPKTGDSFSQSKIRFPNSLLDIVPENDSIFWVCGPNFFAKADLKNSRLEPIKDCPKKLFSSICQMPDKQFLMVSAKGDGVLYFDKKDGRFLQKNNFPGLPNAGFGKNVDWSEIHPNGNWYSQIPLEGIYFGNAHKEKFSTFLHGHKVQAIAEDLNGHIWAADFGTNLFEFSSNESLLAVHSGKTLKADSFIGLNNRFLFFDRENRAWIGGWNGLQIKEPNQTRFEVCTGGENLFLHGIQLQDGRLLFSEINGGVYEAKKSDRSKCGFEFNKLSQILSKKVFTTLFQAKNGLIYACRELAGIAVFDPNKDFKEVGFLEIPGEINHYYEPPGGEFLWISTSNGLVKYRQTDSTFDIFDQKDSLQNTYVQSVFPDKSGNLWLSTHRGIIRFSPQKKEFRQYLQSDGISGLEFNVFAGLQKANGEILFGSMNGISVFDPEKMPQMEAAKRPLITEILINDQPAIHLACQKTGATNPMEMQSISLGRNQNTISFRFSQPEFGDPKRVSFQYKLAGIDEKWVRSNPNETARYANLPPGKYEFLLRGFNSDGFESREMARLEVVVRPAFWQTGWFKFLILGVIFGISYALYRYRIAHLRREFALGKSALENEKKALESTLSALLAQMNPHFIFNSLNSINAFIVKNEGPEASNYLHKFAGLMRQILDYSSLKTISLEKEIAFLNDYLAIESLRMKGRIWWKISLADDVDDFDTEIPPMILQPFVENAIWHGISPKPGGGRILIDFKKENGGLVCTIEDNGIGLAGASVKKHGHESKSQSITRERLALFDLQNGTRSGFELLEIKSADGSITGTRAILSLGQK